MPSLKDLPRKYSKWSIAEALETAKQRLTALATTQRRYIREVEAQMINRMFITEQSLLESDKIIKKNIQG